MDNSKYTIAHAEISWKSTKIPIPTQEGILSYIVGKKIVDNIDPIEGNLSRVHFAI